METPVFEKEVNGHSMTIHFHDDGEKVTEAVLWCHTCDPEGANQVVRTTENESLVEASKGLMESAENHATA